MNNKLRLIGETLLAAGLNIFLYVLLHESGHLIVMLYAGATVTDFSILGAHVSATGGNYTFLSDLWLQANGMLLPLITAFLYMLSYRSGVKNSFYRLFSWFVCLIPIGSVPAWVFIPLLYVGGNAPAADDVTHFLEGFSQSADPLFVSGIAVCLIGIGVFLAIKKKIPQGYLAVLKELNDRSVNKGSDAE